MINVHIILLEANEHKITMSDNNEALDNMTYGASVPRHDSKLTITWSIVKPCAQCAVIANARRIGT